MGSDTHYPEERPRRHACVEPFSIDRTLVTNAQFDRFVAATGYVTTAEIPIDPAEFGGLARDLAVAGSLVFVQATGPVDLAEPGQWWRFVAGADWRHPSGPDSSLDGLEDHPVVQVTYADAVAYASFAGKTLPTEAQWEFAARGGLRDAEFAWGDALFPDGSFRANIWHGEFPVCNDLTDGWARTSPVGAFPANGYDMFDMIGNVWEWTSDILDVPVPLSGTSCCGGPSGNPPLLTRQRVIKGGSHLCAENYCRRYRPAARAFQAVETSTSHLGFRCVR